jgi:ParB family chromosome partitioning protein
MAEGFRFIEPHRGHELALEDVPTEKLEIIEHQRKASPAHIKHLAASIDRMGFVIPLTVVRESDRYVVIDGQHRLLAAKELGITSLPVIVVPGELSVRMMNLNVEKDPNIREKSTVALSVYKELVKTKPETSENDEQIKDAIENIYYVTLGLGYQEASRLAGSSFEPILKRCDDPLDNELQKAQDIRKARAAALVEANELVRSIVERVRDLMEVGAYVNQQIVSYANPYKRKGAAFTFDEAFEKLIARLRKVDEDPEAFAHKVLGG